MTVHRNLPMRWSPDGHASPFLKWSDKPEITVWSELSLELHESVRSLEQQDQIPKNCTDIGIFNVAFVVLVPTPLNVVDFR